MSHTSEQFEIAKQYLAGGVSASTRVNRALGRPMYFDRAEGCRVWDLDGREYIDLCCSHGATLLGHGDSRVLAAVEQALATGAPCSYENEQHTELARYCARRSPAASASASPAPAPRRRCTACAWPAPSPAGRNS